MDEEELQGLPDELDEKKARDLLGNPVGLLDSYLSEVEAEKALPDEFGIEDLPRIAQQLNLDSNYSIDSLPEELDFAGALKFVKNMGTSSMGVGVPETGTKSVKTTGSSGLATAGFYGPMPKIKGGVLTQGFGAPVNYEKNGKHNGVDIAGPLGTPIPSVEDGEVVAVEDQGNKAFGKSIVVRNSDGSYSRYSHLNDFRVSKGQKIRAGDVIGGMGNTGYVIPMGGGTGVHLDYRRVRG